ncbi:hypothetical protein GCM10011583_28300 [Streptomyces camponoticapitis]|uniref:Uncharacterized protein n=1 Tax=Streptomyces camponoticapitis TaxID=1616125 RepID=A0ABQ2E6S5_9ACTN|nr:hypothetical protein GCM10011583_28300 [Streptomyces camponoticapitis]
MLRRGIDTGHVVAERPVCQRQRHHQREQLQHTGKDGAHQGSEPLREQKGEDEIAQQNNSDDKTDNVLHAHSLATPLATKATNANNTIVVTTKARSAIANS